jgi:hypothetical protein
MFNNKLFSMNLVRFQQFAAFRCRSLVAIRYTACAYIKIMPHAKKQAIYKLKRIMFEFAK